MIAMQVTVDVKDDRRVVLTLPAYVPTGKTELLVSISPHAEGKSAIEIVDRGRGPQLSTSRITVQDVVPYLQEGCSNGEIMTVMPVLSEAEIEVVRQYVRDHYEAVMERDRQIRERNAKRTTPPEIQAIRDQGNAKALALKEQFAKKRAQEFNGGHAPS